MIITLIGHLLDHIPLVGGLLGFIFSYIGKNIKTNQQIKMLKVQHQQTLEVTRLQGQQKMSFAKLKAQNTKQIDVDKYNLAVQQTAQIEAKAPVGKLIAGLRASVRPLVTYAFVGIFFFVKVWEATHGAGWMVLWDVQSQTIFATILAFWFGSRLMEKN